MLLVRKKYSRFKYLITGKKDNLKANTSIPSPEWELFLFKFRRKGCGYSS